MTKSAIFQVLRMSVYDTPPCMDNKGVPVQFDDPKIAAEWCRTHGRITGEKLCVKAVDDPEWRRREHARFTSGQYRTLPWANSPWWNAAYPIHKDHFAHASLQKEGCVAYTKNAEEGAKDRQTIVRVGAYLNLFEKTLHDFGMPLSRVVSDFMKLYEPVKVRFAETEEDMTTVFDSVQTCMSGKDWPKDIHPATVYAAGDLAIAYIGAGPDTAKARALVWPEKKLHSRVYGDIARLTNGLESLGYRWGAPIGAKLQRVKLRTLDIGNEDRQSGCFLVPYIDRRNMKGGGHLAVKDEGDHLIICDDGAPGSHAAGLANGYSGKYTPKEGEVPTYLCDKCGNRPRRVYDVYQCGPNEDGDFDDAENWCIDCAQRYSWQCGWSEYRFNKYNVESTVVNGTTWLPYYVKMYAKQCAFTGAYFGEDRITKVSFETGPDKWVSHQYIKKHGGTFCSDLTMRVFLMGASATFYGADGRYGYGVCATHELAKHTFQCDICDAHWMITKRYQRDDALLCPECAGGIGMDAPLSARRKKEDRERHKQRKLLQAAE